MSFSLSQLAKNLWALSTTAASRVTAAVAPELTAIANKTFDAGTDPYGVAWDPGADGKRITLRGKTGALKRFLTYVSIGTRLRVSLGVPYAKYQIGRRPVFPKKGSQLPPAYVESLTKATANVARTILEGR